MSDNQRLRTRLLAFMAALAGVAALRASYPVTMPLAFALIIIAAVWPIKPWLDRMLPSWLSYTATIMVLVLSLVLFGTAVYFSAAAAAQALIEKWPTLAGMYDLAVSWARAQGIPLAPSNNERAYSIIQAFVSGTYTFVVYLGFVGIVVVLGLPEVPAASRKLRAQLEAPARQEVLQAIEEIADKVRSYFRVTIATSLLTGVASVAWSWAMGLELGLTWGLLNFLLNFIPVIGNIIGIIPPTLYALVQFGDPASAAIIFAGFAVIQIVISNIIYPLMQGQSLSLSPVAIILALAFWSWVWGVAGALIAVPLTAATVIICDGFEQTRWLAKLLSRPRKSS